MADYPFRPSRFGSPGTTAVTAGQLWRRVPAARRAEAAEAFWAERNVAAHLDALAEIARHLKFRPKSVQALPTERKVRYLAGLTTLSDAVASHVLVAYHLATKRPMMSAFLNALGLKHEDGVIAEPDALSPPDAKKLGEAARQLFEQYAAEEVELYLSTLLVQDVTTWGGLAEILEARSAAS